MISTSPVHHVPRDGQNHAIARTAKFQRVQVCAGVGRLVDPFLGLDQCRN